MHPTEKAARCGFRVSGYPASAYPPSVRYLQRGATVAFSLSATGLIVFATVKEAKPAGSTVMPVLWGALVASALIWVLAEALKWLDERRTLRRHPGCHAAASFVNRRLEAGNRLLKFWPEYGQHDHLIEVVSEWEMETYRGLGEMLPEKQAYFRTEVGIVPEYAGEPETRLVLRRRIHRLSEIAERL